MSGDQKDDQTGSWYTRFRGILKGEPASRDELTELLRDDSRNAVKKAQEQGSSAVLREWPSMAHVFQIVSWLPETRRWLTDAGDFAGQCWEAAAASKDANQIT